MKENKPVEPDEMPMETTDTNAMQAALFHFEKRKIQSG